MATHRMFTKTTYEPNSHLTKLYFPPQSSVPFKLRNISISITCAFLYEVLNSLSEVQDVKAISKHGAQPTLNAVSFRRVYIHLFATIFYILESEVTSTQLARGETPSLCSPFVVFCSDDATFYRDLPGCIHFFDYSI